MEHDCSYTEASCSKLQHLPPLICRVRHSQCVTALGWLWEAKNKKWSQNWERQTFSFKNFSCFFSRTWIYFTTEMTSNWGSKFLPSSYVEQGLPGSWSVGCCLWDWGLLLPLEAGMKLSGPEEVVQHSSTAGILKHISTCCRQTCPTKSTVSKSFCLYLEVNWGSKLIPWV